MLRGDLDWIVLKAIEKDRNRRYETANALALDIERYLHDEPVRARPPSTLYRCQKFVGKYRAFVSAAFAFVVLLVAATVVSVRLAKLADRERVRAEQAHVESVANEANAVNRLWEAYLAQARANRWSGRPGRRFDSLDVLAKAAPIRPAVELRNEAIACMTLPDLKVGRSLNAFILNSGVGLDPAFERYAISDEAGIRDDGRLLAAGDAKGVIFLDLKRCHELARLQTERVDSLAFLPDQSGLIIRGDAGLFHWPLAASDNEGESLRLGPPRSLAAVRFWRGLTLDAAGHRIAASHHPEPSSTNPDYNIVLDLHSTSAPFIIEGPANPGAAALSPDGKWLATGAWRGREVRVWNAITGHRVRTLPVEDSALFPSFSPNGRRLVAGTAGAFYCWEVGTWRLLYRLAPGDTPTGQPGTAAFSPDGELIAVFHRYNRTHLIDARRGHLLATLDLDRHESLCFTRDGGSLIMAAAVGQLKILDLRLIRRQLAKMNLDWDMPPLPRSRFLPIPERLVLSVVTNAVAEVDVR